MLIRINRTSFFMITLLFAFGVSGWIRSENQGEAPASLAGGLGLPTISLQGREGDRQTMSEIADLAHQKRNSEADKKLKVWMKKDAKSPVPFVLAGTLAYERKQYKRCLSYCEKALSRDPQFADAYYWRGKAFEALGKPMEAVNEYRAALLSKPDHAQAKASLSALASSLGVNEEDLGVGGHSSDGRSSDGRAHR